MRGMLRFKFEWWASIVDNRQYNHSKLRRMCDSATLELNIPFTDYHVLTELSTSLFQWLESPDSWQITTDGMPTREKVFPHAEWVDCPDCGEEVPSDLRGGHACKVDMPKELVE